MSVVSSIESVGPCRKRLHIEVPAPAVDAETERVVREYGRKVRLPGFRSGKVPAAVVQQRFKSEIEREVLDRLVPRYWKQAQAESSLDPLLPPSVEDVELKSGEPLVFVATVEVRPPIQLGDIVNFDLPPTDTAAHHGRGRRGARQPADPGRRVGRRRASGGARRPGLGRDRGALGRPG